MMKFVWDILLGFWLFITIFFITKGFLRALWRQRNGYDDLVSLNDKETPDISKIEAEATKPNPPQDRDLEPKSVKSHQDFKDLPENESPRKEMLIEKLKETIK